MGVVILISYDSDCLSSSWMLGNGWFMEWEVQLYIVVPQEQDVSTEWRGLDHRASLGRVCWISNHSFDSKLENTRDVQRAKCIMFAVGIKYITPILTFCSSTSWNSCALQHATDSFHPEPCDMTLLPILRGPLEATLECRRSNYHPFMACTNARLARCL